jgi:hypothetical protein
MNDTNIHIYSAITISALIHDHISSFSLDILALLETRFLHNTPNTIRNDIAPAGFSVCHVHRQPSAKHSLGDRLAIVHRLHNVVKAHPLAATVNPGSFELQLVRITSTRPSLTVCNAYRPPSLSIAQFHHELADVMTAVSDSTVDRLLLSADLNSPRH